MRALHADDESDAVAMLTQTQIGREQERPLRVWARASTSTRRLAAADVDVIANAAVGALLAPLTAYAHG